MRKIYLAIMLFSVFTACNSKKTEQSITVYCAASLTGVMTEMADSFTSIYKIPHTLNFASSGTLARQIEMGAGADIFISADKKWMDHIKSLGLCDTSTLSIIARNTLVLIAGLGVDTAGMTISKAISKRFIMGDPALVPAGSYAKETLKNLNIWTESNNFLLGQDAKNVLKLVEMGEAETGLVYKTDALSSQKVIMIEEMPDSLHTPIQYYLCGVRKSPGSENISFLEFLSGQMSQTILKKHGFNIPS